MYAYTENLYLSVHVHVRVERKVFVNILLNQNELECNSKLTQNRQNVHQSSYFYILKFYTIGIKIYMYTVSIVQEANYCLIQPLHPRLKK